MIFAYVFAYVFVFLFPRILIRTGNPEHKDDILRNGSLLVLPEDESTPGIQDMGFTVASKGLFVVALFKDGIAHVQFTEDIGKISSVKVVVDTNNENWMIVSEVKISLQKEKNMTI